MKKHTLGFCLLTLICASLVLSCNNSQQLSAKQTSAIKSDIAQFTNTIAKDISAKGPIAWLSHFDNSPDFFMASDGLEVFHSYNSANTFIQDTLTRVISKINLRWDGMRIDALSPKIAIIGSDFHEDITMADGKTAPIEGYFTGTALLTETGWKLRNAHWSIKHK